MSLVGFGANKGGRLETTPLEAVDRNKWNASKRLGFVLDYVPTGDNTAQGEFYKMEKCTHSISICQQENNRPPPYWESISSFKDMRQ